MTSANHRRSHRLVLGARTGKPRNSSPGFTGTDQETRPMTPVAYWRHARTRLRSRTTAACLWAQGWPRRPRGRRAEQRQLAHGCKASQGGNEAERRAEGRVLCCTTKWTLRQEGRLSGCVSRRLVEAGARGAYVEQERGRGGKPRVMAPPGGPRMGAGRIGPTPVYDGDTPGLLGHREALARTDARRDPVGRPADAARRDPTQCTEVVAARRQRRVQGTRA